MQRKKEKWKLEIEIIEQAVKVLSKGGNLLYPTDTIWGIGCDARNTTAVERLYAIKQRDHSKSMIVLCSSDITPDMARHVPTTALSANGRPTTYILPRSIWHDELRLSVADNIPAADGTLGIRIPNHAFCQEAIHRLGAPLVSTSANFSGQPSPQHYNEIADDLKSRLDYCVPPLPELLSSETRGSRIVKVNTDGSTTVIRP